MSGLSHKVLRRLPAGLKKGISRAVHPARRSRMKRALGGKISNLGLLSVVIPVYNVELFLADCLNSVVSQSYPYLEIIIVDDGSTDKSLSIAQEYSRRDQRIKVIELSHGGNGRARNLAIEASKGQYLTFADSDDVVAPDAYATMMKQLMDSGSDFVVASSDRIIGNKHVQSKALNRLHAKNRISTTIKEYPEILDDVFLWNKLFNRTFWDSKVSPIPEGILYEDQEATAKAYIRAERFDVIKFSVYSWRQRPGSSSITQGKADLQNLKDRLTIAQDVSQLIVEEGTDALAQVWYKRLLGSDMLRYFDIVASQNEEYWRILSGGTTSISSYLLGQGNITIQTIESMDPHARVYLHLASCGSYEETLKVVTNRMDVGSEFRVVSHENRLVAIPDYWNELSDIENRLELNCSPDQMKFDSDARLRDMRDGRGLVIKGHAFVRGLESDFSNMEVRCVITLNDGSQRVASTSFIDDPTIDIQARDYFASHSRSGFEIELMKHQHLDGTALVTVEIIVGESRISSEHTFELSQAFGKLKEPSKYNSPTAVRFSTDEDSESLSIDIDWGGSVRPFEVFLSTAQQRIDYSSVSQQSSTCERYTFELHHLHWGVKVYSYPSGAYTLRYKLHGNDRQLSIKSSTEISIKSPMHKEMSHSSVMAWVAAGNNFAVTVAPPLTLNEQSKYGQRILQGCFRGEMQASLKDHFVFESFSGKFCTDSPRALADELNHQNPDSKIFFSIADFSVPYPEYAEPIVIGTKAWFSAVSSARMVVNNSSFPYYFRRNRLQEYLQTWHGTPIKFIGRDAPTNLISSNYRYNLLRESKDWTSLLAQNEYAKGVFEKCFSYKGEILVEGYPRNDSTNSGQNRRDELRRHLGIQEDQFAILVAPTWRDEEIRKDLTSGTGDVDLFSIMDSCDDRFRFLVRSHHNESGRRKTTDHSKAIDVSDYHQINDLMIASDALISDYSSTVFDFLNQNKPFTLYIPPDSNYEKVRGTYLKIDEEFENNISRSSSEIISFMESSADFMSFENNTGFLKDRYSAHDDGLASLRVLGKLRMLEQSP